MEVDDTLKWSGSFAVAPPSRTPKLPGDKILLPQSALEQLIAAAPVKVTEASRPLTTNFDPFNPYTYAAERAARQQYEDRQPELPHPLMFRLVNPDNGRVIYAGIRESTCMLGIPEWPVSIQPYCRVFGLDFAHYNNACLSIILLTYGTASTSLRFCIDDILTAPFLARWSALSSTLLSFH